MPQIPLKPSSFFFNERSDETGIVDRVKQNLSPLLDLAPCSLCHRNELFVTHLLCLSSFIDISWETSKAGAAV